MQEPTQSVIVVQSGDAEMHMRQALEEKKREQEKER
jgi:cellobiose-specific phosphotransferase system component IIA